jgi:hypothetical protein
MWKTLKYLFKPKDKYSHKSLIEKDSHENSKYSSESYQSKTYKKRSKVAPTSSIQSIISPRKTKKIIPIESHIISTPEKSRKLNTAASMIGKFLKNTEDKRKLKYLVHICSKSGECLAIGKENAKILKYFDNFDNFHYLEYPIQLISNQSANGYVFQLKYTKYNTSVYAILKSTLNSFTDNLGYEYIVGKFINEQSKRFPCFVETYGLFIHTSTDTIKALTEKITTEKNRNKMSKNKVHLIDISEHTLKNIYPYSIHDDDILGKYFKKYTGHDDYINYTCKNSIGISILTQHISNSETMEKLFNNVSKRKLFLSQELHFVLFQIYFPLMALRNKFTHYDLHMNNVLLYTLENNSYLEYNYYFQDGRIIQFKSKYIAKIIDYGRSFFYENEDKNSLNIYHELCNSEECNLEIEYENETIPSVCGDNYGYSNMESPEKWNKRTEQSKEGLFFINSAIYNQSHDLTLINHIKLFKKIMKSYLVPEMQTLINNLVGREGIGVLDRPSSYADPSTDEQNIQNVTDVVALLYDCIMREEIKQANDGFYNDAEYKNIGSFHIYEKDKPMVFNSVI